MRQCVVMEGSLELLSRERRISSILFTTPLRRFSSSGVLIVCSLGVSDWGTRHFSLYSCVYRH